MVSVTAGSDTYGSVKKVGGTRVVTKFAMLNAVPLYPLTSFYCTGAGPTTSAGIPFVFNVRNSSVVGLPLARLDRLSVTMAYLRGVCGLLMVIGSFSIIPLVMGFSGERPDDFARIATVVFISSLVAGVTFGAMSYLIPFGMSERARSIRLWCGEILGLNGDPASLRADVARDLVNLIGEAFEPKELEGVDRLPKESVGLIRDLIVARLEIALGTPPDPREVQTNRLLERLGTHPYGE